MKHVLKGANHPAVRRAPAGAGDCQAGRRQPADGAARRRASPPRKALRACCATRPVRPASRQCRRPRCMPSSSGTLREPPGAVTLTGPAAPWPRRWVFRCERSSAYGPPISSSRTGSGPSSDPTIPTSPPSYDVVESLHEPAPPRGSGLHRRESQIHALDRTQPGLPRSGNAQPSCTITNATARRPCSPRSACSKARSSGRCAPRHRHQGVHPLHRNRRAV